jgi:hypothetical protein
LKRKTLSQKVRFEVFKRDSFKCQYCGASAPDAILRCDHIEPVSKGGDNRITNLITACQDCNSGKGATRIEDHSVVEKVREHLGDLQAHKSQIEMMLKWQKSLSSKEQMEERAVAKFWNEKTGTTLNPSGLKSVRSLLSKYKFQEVISAVDKASGYICESGDRIAIEASAVIAFSKLKSICSLTRQDAIDPGIKDAFYVRAIIRNRFGLSDCDKRLILPAIRSAVSDLGLDDVKTAAKTCISLMHFRRIINDSTKPTKEYCV